MNTLIRDLAACGAELALALGLLFVVLADAFAGRRRDQIVRAATLASLVFALGVVVAQYARPVSRSLFEGALVLDPLALFFKVLLLGAALAVVSSFGFHAARELRGLGRGEFHALVLALTFGSLLLSAAGDLVMLYLALETVSITSYVLVAYVKGDRLSNEASLKYLLFGAVSTAVMLYGLTLLYGLTGSTRLEDVRAALVAGLGLHGETSLLVVLVLVLAGLGFKVAAVPFHFWCPDAYQGAPVSVAALLSVAPKVAGFAVLMRFCFGTLSSPGAADWQLHALVEWPALLALLAALTMTVGNLAALTQSNMKRLLAYSSIAHAGYVLMGLVALSGEGARGTMIYLLGYLAMNLGAFLVVLLVHHHEGTFDLRDYAGLGQRAPWLAWPMGIFLLSLTGIPPLVGFMAKFQVFAAVIEQGPALAWLAVVGALNAALGAAVYFRVLKTMLIDGAIEAPPAVAVAWRDRVALATLAAANLLPLLFWPLVEAWTRSSLVMTVGGR
jgi:NADH-quinone oxidoreductase subunit N